MFPSEFCAANCLPTSNSVTALTRHPRLEGLDEGFAAGVAGIIIRVPAKVTLGKRTSRLGPSALGAASHSTCSSSLPLFQASSEANVALSTVTDHCHQESATSEPLVAPKVSLVSATAFKLSMTQGDVYKFRYHSTFEDSLVSSTLTSLGDPPSVPQMARDPKDPANLIPREYQDYLDVFSKATADKLPQRRPYDHQILIPEGTDIPTS
jgi:hypothetical protein